MDIIWITDAEYIDDYVIRFTFNDGKTSDIDLKPILLTRQKLFKPILNLDIFRKFSLNGWTISWLDGRIDIAPESIYALA